MSRVIVKGYLTFRDLLGGVQGLELEGDWSSLEELLWHLARELGDEFKVMAFDPSGEKLADHVAVLVNGCHHTHLPDRLDTELHDGDEVAIFPPLVGGKA
jgi:molybdopterin converting factor small subunit